MKQDNDNVVSFDMMQHAFVLAVPLGVPAPGVEGGRLAEPVFCVNGGTGADLMNALRAIADMIERNGLASIGRL